MTFYCGFLSGFSYGRRRAGGGGDLDGRMISGAEEIGGTSSLENQLWGLGRGREIIKEL